MVDISATSSPGETDDETQILSVPIELRRSGREIKMLIEGPDPFATAKPDARLIKLLIRARRFNATLGQIGQRNLGSFSTKRRLVRTGRHR